MRLEDLPDSFDPGITVRKPDPIHRADGTGLINAFSGIRYGLRASDCWSADSKRKSECFKTSNLILLLSVLSLPSTASSIPTVTSYCNGGNLRKK